MLITIQNYLLQFLSYWAYQHEFDLFQSLRSSLLRVFSDVGLVTGFFDPGRELSHWKSHRTLLYRVMQPQGVSTKIEFYLHEPLYSIELFEINVHF